MDAPTLRLLARLAAEAADFLGNVAAALRDAARPPSKPGPLTLGKPEQRFHMAREYLKYPVTLPSLDDADQDVQERELTISIDGTSFILKGAHEDELTFEAPVGATVSLSLVDIDVSGNRSQASEPVEFTAIDDIAPHQPGLLTLGTATQVFKDDAPAPDQSASGESPPP